MLGRKQSIKQDTILADYGGNEELLNENTDVEWVNKVRIFIYFDVKKIKLMYFLAMGTSYDAILCSSFTLFRLPKHPKNL